MGCKEQGQPALVSGEQEAAQTLNHPLRVMEHTCHTQKMPN